MKKSFFIECILCAILLFTGITLYYREHEKTAEVGTFTDIKPSNASFGDFTASVFSEFFDE